MALQWKIRPAIDSDDLRAIWREVYGIDYRPLLPTSVDLRFEPRGAAYVAEVNGAAAGFCYVDADWLDELWVSKPFQNYGIGSSLVGHAEAIMKAAGIRQASLSSLQANVRARALYCRLGWIESHRFMDRQSGVWNLKFLKTL
jgi:GNAT superfamily N-acetyltransferase